MVATLPEEIVTAETVPVRTGTLETDEADIVPIQIETGDTEEISENLANLSDQIFELLGQKEYLARQEMNKLSMIFNLLPKGSNQTTFRLLERTIRIGSLIYKRKVQVNDDTFADLANRFNDVIANLIQYIHIDKIDIDEFIDTHDEIDFVRFQTHLNTMLNLVQHVQENLYDDFQIQLLLIESNALTPISNNNPHLSSLLHSLKQKLNSIANVTAQINS